MIAETPEWRKVYNRALLHFYIQRGHGFYAKYKVKKSLGFWVAVIVIDGK